jgi:hypothetical protein
MMGNQGEFKKGLSVVTVEGYTYKLGKPAACRAAYQPKMLVFVKI